MPIITVLLESKRCNEQGSRNIIYIKTKETSKSNHRDNPIRKRSYKIKNPRF